MQPQPFPPRSFDSRHAPAFLLACPRPIETPASFPPPTLLAVCVMVQDFFHGVFSFEVFFYSFFFSPLWCSIVEGGFSGVELIFFLDHLVVCAVSFIICTRLILFLFRF